MDMKKRILTTVICITSCVILASCGKKGNEGKDPLTGEEQSATQESSSEVQTGDNRDFDTVVSEASRPQDIIDYLNTNLPNASNEDTNRYLTGLLGYGNDVRDIDFTQLEESRQYMPEDMIAFMDLMKLEADTPSMVMSTEENRKVIGMTLSEMLERALLFEHHLDKYPDNVTTNAAWKLYEEIATAAITGGYDRENGIEHYYQGETSDVVDEKSLAYYQQFAEANPDSRLGRLVAEYVTLLQSKQFKIDEDMEQFYRSIALKLQPERTDVTNDTNNVNETGANGTNNVNGMTTNGDNNVNGTVTNGTNTTNGNMNKR